MSFFHLLIFSAIFVGCNSNVKGSVNVTTNVGTITGTEEHVKLFGQKYQMKVFRGIPYAEPPVGVLRFKRAVPKAAFANGYNATKFGYACPQAYATKINGLVFNYTSSEDCLFLNVFAPFKASVSNLRPVMVYIHGGAGLIGSSSFYDGTPMAAFGDVVFVSLNYRLGAFGYLDTGDSNAPANNGLFDELLALHWIKDNINAFGGDPNMITVFGQSVGSFDLTLHSISPLSGGKGLFHRAIPESGAAMFPFPKHLGYVQNPLLKTKKLGKLLGCDTTDSTAMVACMRTKSTKEIIRQANAVGTSWDFAWGPTVDGKFIPRLPEDLFFDPGLIMFSGFSNIELMIGTNSADGDVYLYKYPALANGTITKEDMVNKFLRQVVQGIPNSEKVLNALVQEYVSPQEITGRQRMLDCLDFVTDRSFIGPAVATALTHRRMSQHPTTYMYSFNYLSPLTQSGAYPGKVQHSGELFYLFFLPSLMMNNQTWIHSIITAADVELSKAMLYYWTNFAKFGNPNGNISDPGRVKAFTEFPEFVLDNKMYLDINGTYLTGIKLTPEKNQREKRMRFWLDYLPYIVKYRLEKESVMSSPSCPPVRSLAVDKTQSAVLILAIATAVFACVSVILIISFCKAKKASSLQDKSGFNLSV